MVPPLADQLTEVSVVPLTVAVNCSVPLIAIQAEVGEMVMLTAGTVTVAEAAIDVLAELVAVTV